MSSSEATQSPAQQLWQKKLAFLQTEEAKAVDAAQKFKLSEDIAEAREKLAELERQASVRPDAVVEAGGGVADRTVGEPGSVALARNRRSVFVGYGHQESDRALAHTFADALGRAGHEVFIDTGAHWGTRWAKRIRDALEGADCLLLLLSREAATREMVAEEVAIARRLADEGGVPVILPIRLRYPLPEPLPYLLSVYLRGIRQQSWEGPDDTPGLVERLLAHVEAGEAWAETLDAGTPSAPFSSSLPAPFLDPRRLAFPGGAIDTEARYYVLRRADEVVIDVVCRPRGLVTLQGPRQSGKTSLILRALESLRQPEGDLRAAFVDFQALAGEDFESLDAVWRAITRRLADRLQLDEHSWQEGRSYESNVERFLDRALPAGVGDRLLLCFDEVDRVFHYRLRADFFASLRAFYNRGAFDRSWKRVSWLLGTSSEPAFFIEDLSQSPFNVGLRVELAPFTVAEIADFAHRFGRQLPSVDAERIFFYVGGQPYLVHLLLFHLTCGDVAAEQLFDADKAARTVFRDHLHRFLLHFQQEEALARAMQRVVAGQGCDDARLADRLRAAGLVRRDRDDKLIPLGDLYAEFFSREL